MGKLYGNRVNPIRQRFAMVRIVALAILAIGLSMLGSQHAASTPSPQFNLPGLRSATPSVPGAGTEVCVPFFL